MGGMKNADELKDDEQGEEVVEQRDEPQVVEQRDEPWAVVNEQGEEQRDELVEQRLALMETIAPVMGPMYIIRPVPEGFHVHWEFQNKLSLIHI